MNKLCKFLITVALISTGSFTLPTRPQYEVVDVYVIDHGALNTNPQQGFGNRRCNGGNCAFTTNPRYPQYPQYPHTYPNNQPTENMIIVLVPESDNFKGYQPNVQPPNYHPHGPPPLNHGHFPPPHHPVIPPSQPHGNPWNNRPVNLPNPYPIENYPTPPHNNLPNPQQRPKPSITIGQRPDVPINNNKPSTTIGQRPNVPINNNKPSVIVGQRPNTPINNNSKPSQEVTPPPFQITSSTIDPSLDETISKIFGRPNESKPELPVYNLDVRINE